MFFAGFIILKNLDLFMKLNCSFSSFEKEVFEKVKQIPKGRVATYREVARAVGRENAARAVGNALAKNPFLIIIPCHRVIKSDLTLGDYSRGREMKKKLLEGEGIEFEGNRVKPEFLFTFKFYRS